MAHGEWGSPRISVSCSFYPIVFCILSLSLFFFFFFFSQFFRQVQYTKYLCSQSRQNQWSSITHPEIPFLLIVALAPPLFNPASIFFSNELRVCCHCPRAESKIGWERNWHGDKQIHGKMALLGSEVISRGPLDRVSKRKKVSRMWESKQGKGG